MDVKGVQGRVSFDGRTVSIVKKEVGKPAWETRLDVRQIAGVTMKPGTFLFHGYVQFHAAGTVAAAEETGLMTGGRPPYSDPNSLSIPRRSNDAAAKLVAAVEEARGRL